MQELEGKATERRMMKTIVEIEWPEQTPITAQETEFALTGYFGRPDITVSILDNKPDVITDHNKPATTGEDKRP